MIKARWLAVLLLVLVGAAIDRQASAQTAPAPRTLSIATVAPPGSPMLRGLEAWSRELRRRTGGALQFRFYAGGVQGDDAEIVRKIRSGRLDGGTLSSTGLGTIYRPALIFQLPATFRSYDALDRARTELGPEIEQGIVDAGFRLMGWSDVGQARLFSTERIASPSDLRGRRMWQRTDDVIAPALMSRIAGTGVPLSLNEVLGALSSGRIDTFLAPPAVAIALQWSSRARFVNDLPMAIVIGGLVISERTFQSLDDAQRAALTETGTQFHALGRRTSRRMEASSLEAVVQHGITLVPTTEADRQAWRTLGREVRDAVAGQIADPALIARAVAIADAP